MAVGMITLVEEDMMPLFSQLFLSFGLRTVHMVKGPEFLEMLQSIGALLFLPPSCKMVSLGGPHVVNDQNISLWFATGPGIDS